MRYVVPKWMELVVAQLWLMKSRCNASFSFHGRESLGEKLVIKLQKEKPLSLDSSESGLMKIGIAAGEF